MTDSTIFRPMKEDQERSKGSPGSREDMRAEGFVKETAREVGKELFNQSKLTLKWALGGAVVGALALGGVGFWFLGLSGLGVGALIGAVLGGFVGGWLYLQIS